MSVNAGIILPLHVGHVAPQPSPEPVALTKAPAKIETIDKNRPNFAYELSFTVSYLRMYLKIPKTIRMN